MALSSGVVHTLNRLYRLGKDNPLARPWQVAENGQDTKVFLFLTWMILTPTTKYGEDLARTGMRMEVVERVNIPTRNTVLPPN